MKILLSEAENWVKPGRSKIYDDARKGLLSTEKDPTKGNKKVVDTAELQRVYGEIHNPKESDTDNSGQQIAPSILLHAYENQIQDLHKQLELAGERETALISEKAKLLDLLLAEKEEKRALMPPPAETTEPDTTQQKQGWFSRLIGVR